MTRNRASLSRTQLVIEVNNEWLPSHPRVTGVLEMFESDGLSTEDRHFSYRVHG